MTKIKITRLKEKINSEREIEIYLDKKKIGAVSNGGTKEFSVPAGKHNLRARIDWCGSDHFPIEVINDETKEYKLSAFKNATKLLNYSKKASTYGIGIVMIVIFFNEFLYGYLGNWLILFGLPFFIPLLFLFYYMSFGRNKYLVIKECRQE